MDTWSRVDQDKSEIGGEMREIDMSKWRPDNWEKVKKEDCARVGGFFNGDTPAWVKSDLLCFEAGADRMLDALKREIEGVENPYQWDDFDYEKDRWQAFNDCRQAILEKLK